MKKGLKKILAVVLTLSVLLCTGASLTANAYYIEYPESGELEITGIYYGAPGEFTPFDVSCPDVDFEYYYPIVLDTDIGDCVYDDNGDCSGFEGYQTGVTIINVVFCNENDEIVADQYNVFVVSDGEDMGELTYATAYNIDAKYKEEGCLSLYLDYDSEEMPYYCVLVDDLDSPIYLEGESYYADAVGSGSAIVYVIDAHGNVFPTVIEVNVNYTLIQWIIRILFFGWLWY